MLTPPIVAELPLSFTNCRDADSKAMPKHWEAFHLSGCLLGKSELEMKIVFLSVLFLACCLHAEVNSERLGELLSMNHEEVHEGGSAAGIFSGAEVSEWVEPTPEQPKGPFYPIRLPDDTDYDLTVTDDGLKAKGVEVYVQGQVMDTDGKPIAGAIVEIWQACQSGKYNHPRDPNNAIPDENFQYYSAVETDENGQYVFKTIVPGPYPAQSNWWRPPHIHYQVEVEEYKRLVTQLYFDGRSFPESIATIRGTEITGEFIDRLNDLDFLIKQVEPERRGELVASFDEVEVHGKIRKVGVFNLYLESKATEDAEL